MNKNKLITYLFIITIFIFSLFATVICVNKRIKLAKKKQSSTKHYDWSILYPTEISKTTNNSLEKIKQKNNYIKQKFKSIEEKFNYYIPKRFEFCEIQASINKFLGVRLYLEYDGTVVLNNNYLDYWYKNKPITEPLKNTLELAEYANSLNSKFTFILYPAKNSKYDNQLPIGLKDNNNISCDLFLSELNKNGINTLDLRISANHQFSNQYDLFFKTDHHWKPETGLWAANEIANYINKQFSWNINTELLDKNNFMYTNLPKFFLGSQGKKTTLVYAEPEDFTIIKPNYNTNFERICPDWTNASGTFENIMFNKEQVEKVDYYQKAPYSLYLNGDKPYIRLINNKNYSIDKKILFIRESFNCVVSPFLSLLIKDLTLIDPRHFNGSIKTMIAKEKYDLVIIGYNANCIVNNGETNTKFKFK